MILDLGVVWLCHAGVHVALTRRHVGRHARMKVELDADVDTDVDGHASFTGDKAREPKAPANGDNSPAMSGTDV